MAHIIFNKEFIAALNNISTNSASKKIPPNMYFEILLKSLYEVSISIKFGGVTVSSFCENDVYTNIQSSDQAVDCHLR